MCDCSWHLGRRLSLLGVAVGEMSEFIVAFRTYWQVFAYKLILSGLLMMGLALLNGSI
jgi:hypothetical protein